MDYTKQDIVGIRIDGEWYEIDAGSINLDARSPGHEGVSWTHEGHYYFHKRLGKPSMTVEAYKFKQQPNSTSN